MVKWLHVSEWYIKKPKQKETQNPSLVKGSGLRPLRVSGGDEDWYINSAALDIIEEAKFFTSIVLSCIPRKSNEVA